MSDPTLQELHQLLDAWQRQYPDQAERIAALDQRVVQAAFQSAHVGSAGSQGRRRQDHNNTHTGAGDDIHGRRCPVCRHRPKQADQTMCDRCQELFQPREVGGEHGPCDCGHAPAFGRIYLFSSPEGVLTFCGIKCAADQYSRLFGGLRERR